MLFRSKENENISKSELFLKTIIDAGIESTFPNVTTALRIFSSIAVANCTGERSFSTLNRIKSYLRSTMGERKLNNLSILSIESEFFESMNTETIIENFAKNKCRKKFF